MQEYIVSYNEKWWHFFVNPTHGLCFRKKEGFYFGGFEILLKDIEADFCVLSFGNQIHIVCQDKEGSIIYLIYNGGSWEKTVLLENKNGRSYPKYFRLMPMGNHINLFYIIEYKERLMLVHQILDGSNQAPAVIDYISMNETPFFIIPHISTDATVCYQNVQGVWGFRIFKWSKKDYLNFTPIKPVPELTVSYIDIDREDIHRMVATVSVEQFKNIVYFKRNPNGEYTEPVTVYLDCQANANPILCSNEDKLYMVWQEFGSVMSSFSEDGGKKWSKPVKYVKHSSIQSVLYHVCQNGKYEVFYGYPSENSIQFYAANNMLSRPPKTVPPATHRHKGYDAEEFRKQTDFFMSENPVKEDTPGTFLPIEEWKEEITELRDTISQQNEIILELLRRQNQLEEDLHHAMEVKEPKSKLPEPEFEPEPEPESKFEPEPEQAEADQPTPPSEPALEEPPAEEEISQP